MQAFYLRYMDQCIIQNLGTYSSLETTENMNKGMGKYVGVSTSTLCKKIRRNSRFKILEIIIYTV